MSSKPSPDDRPRVMPRRMARVFKVSIWTAVVAAALLLLDLLLGVRMPQPLRPALPIVIAAAMCVAIVLGIGFYGAPTRPDQARNDTPGPS